MESFRKADLKEPVWSITILAALVKIIRLSLLRQIRINLAVFGRNEGGFRGKNRFQ